MNDNFGWPSLDKVEQDYIRIPVTIFWTIILLIILIPLHILSGWAETIETFLSLVLLAQRKIKMSEKFYKIISGEYIIENGVSVFKQLDEIEVCADYNKCGCGTSSDTHCMYCILPKFLHVKIIKLINDVENWKKESISVP